MIRTRSWFGLIRIFFLNQWCQVYEFFFRSEEILYPNISEPTLRTFQVLFNENWLKINPVESDPGLIQTEFPMWSQNDSDKKLVRIYFSIDFYRTILKTFSEFIQNDSETYLGIPRNSSDLLGLKCNPKFCP